MPRNNYIYYYLDTGKILAVYHTSEVQQESDAPELGMLVLEGDVIVDALSNRVNTSTLQLEGYTPTLDSIEIESINNQRIASALKSLVLYEVDILPKVDSTEYTNYKQALTALLDNVNIDSELLELPSKPTWVKE